MKELVGIGLKILNTVERGAGREEARRIVVMNEKSWELKVSKRSEGRAGVGDRGDSRPRGNEGVYEET